MAESAVSFVVEKLAELLIKESVFLHDVHDQVEWIQRELQYMQAFLKDADAKQDQNALVKEWVADIRKVAYDTEDIIDTFIIKMASQRKGFKGYVKRPTGIFNKGILLHQVGKQIAAIQTAIQHIRDRRSTYGITSIGGVGLSDEGSHSSERIQQLRRSSPYAATDEFVIGLTGEINALVAELMKEEEQCCVVSIVGMGGLGKTTLTRKIYNRSDVVDNFSCCAWVSVSKQYRTRDILERIIKEVSRPSREEFLMIDRMTLEELEEKVFELLKERRYLVVLDDIWSREAWESLKNALPNTGNRSRIMLTTRNKDVALYPDLQTHLHELRCLSEEESWELFCRRVFPGSNTSSCHPNLEKLGRAMVERCGGLPLALIVLGGLLSKNKTFEVWEGVLNNINWHFRNGQGSIILVILGLSYSDLSYYLKSCFLHLSIFPEDWWINVKKLIRYWTVEGIIPQQGTITIEKMAEECFNELSDRSLVQVIKWTKGGRAKTCRIHDLLHDLSVSKAKEQNLLLETIDGNFVYEALHKSSRRCFVRSKSCFDRYHAAATASSSQQHSAMHLRTLVLKDAHDSLSKEQMEFIFKCYQLLRVLDLSGIEINCFPKTIGKLIQLRYLSLDVTSLKKIPSSIGNLRYLQYLQIYNRYNRNGISKKVPNVIWKMEQLRHLLIGYYLIISHLRIGTLRNLQTLDCIEADCWIRGGNDVWNNLTKLVDLQIHGISGSNVELLFHSFSRLNCIQSLSLLMDDIYDTFPNLAPLARFCPRLHKLFLRGRIEELTDPHELPPNLTILRLDYSDLKQDSMVTLGNLPNLRVLILNPESYTEEELVFVEEGFPQLQHLEISFLSNLQEWEVEEGALVMLRRLEIWDCCELWTVPEGLMFMSNLKELVIRDMPTEFKFRLQEFDWYKVQHIPYVSIEG